MFVLKNKQESIRQLPGAPSALLLYGDGTALGPQRLLQAMGHTLEAKTAPSATVLPFYSSHTQNHPIQNPNPNPNRGSPSKLLET